MLTIQTDNHCKMKLLASFLKFCNSHTLHIQTIIYNTADYNNYSIEITAVYIHKITNLQWKTQQINENNCFVGFKTVFFNKINSVVMSMTTGDPTALLMNSIKDNGYTIMVDLLRFSSKD